VGVGVGCWCDAAEAYDGVEAEELAVMGQNSVLVLWARRESVTYDRKTIKVHCPTAAVAHQSP